MASRSRKSRRKRLPGKWKSILRFFLKPVVLISLGTLVLLGAGGLVFLKKGKPLVHAWRAGKAEVSARKAMECFPPAATAMTLPRPAGMLRWPFSLLPHEITVPSALRASPWDSPVETLTSWVADGTGSRPW